MLLQSRRKCSVTSGVTGGVDEAAGQGGVVHRGVEQQRTDHRQVHMYLGTVRLDGLSIEFFGPYGARANFAASSHDNGHTLAENESGRN